MLLHVDLTPTQCKWTEIPGATRTLVNTCTQTVMDNDPSAVYMMTLPITIPVTRSPGYDGPDRNLYSVTHDGSNVRKLIGQGWRVIVGICGDYALVFPVNFHWWTVMQRGFAVRGREVYWNSCFFWHGHRGHLNGAFLPWPTKGFTHAIGVCYWPYMQLHSLNINIQYK